MIVDGKLLAQNVIRSLVLRVAALGRSPTLAIIALSPTRVTDSYLSIKRRVAEQVGVSLELIELSENTTTGDILQILRTQEADGIVLQLPFPSHIDTEALLAQLPLSQDPDALGREAAQTLDDPTTKVLPPVVAALVLMAEEYGVDLREKSVVVIGNGRLVGAPAAAHLRAIGADVMVLTKNETNIGQYTAKADVLVLGAGSPGLIAPNMIKDGVVIFDAGTSEEAGKIVGDADPLCASKASFMTPVPGGVGPLAVAMLFANLLTLAESRQ